MFPGFQFSRFLDVAQPTQFFTEVSTTSFLTKVVLAATTTTIGILLVLQRQKSFSNFKNQEELDIKMEPEQDLSSKSGGHKKGKKGSVKKSGGGGDIAIAVEIPPPPQSPTHDESNHPEKEVILKVELGDPNIPEKEDGSMTELLLLGSREAERNLLVLLNKRLERIIEKNRQLQAANNQLMTQLEVEKEQCSAKVTEVTTRANGDLEKALNDLANAKKEITVLTFKLGAVKKEGDDARNSLQRSLDEVGRLKKQIADLEAQLNDVTNKLKKTTEVKNKTERELNEWKEEAIKLGQVLQDTKTELEKEILAKLDLEAQLKGEIQEKTMKTTLIETEMIQMKATANQLLHEQNEKQQKEFESMLEKNMKNLRDEYTRKLVENKEEQARLYEEKERDHITNKEQLKNNLAEKGAELEKTLKEVKTLTESVRRLETERHALLVQLDDLESERKAERAKLEAEIANRDELLKVKIREQNELLDRCQHLLDVKVALDNELAAYKILLDTEESRLEIGEFVKKDENQNFAPQQQTAA
ncbi:Lamin-A [Folsomia candida]|uniref:Lamin-A n=1 Tax=Folsomia candida TaxID=158441 RepID=A0A226EES1_FOLCA|nr:Lamin-A [Folsomia candida]